MNMILALVNIKIDSTSQSKELLLKFVLFNPISTFNQLLSAKVTPSPSKYVALQNKEACEIWRVS